MTTIDERTKVSWHIVVYLITIAFGAGITSTQYYSIDKRLTRIENYIDTRQRVSTTIDSAGATSIIDARLTSK